MIALVLDHLWQSTLFALAAGLLTLIFDKNGAHIRYWLWFAASVKFLLPFSLLVSAGRALFQNVAPAVTAPPSVYMVQQATQQFAQPFSAANPVLAAPAASTLDMAPILFGLWAIGFVFVMAFWTMRWIKLRTTLHSAIPMNLPAPIPVKTSPALLEPGLIGIWRPVLLLPEGITARLSPQEMYSVLAHELCHFGRRDNLTAAIHMLVEAMFWFHPLVWWLGARLINERERACDEGVVEAGSDPEVYAQGILKVCQHYLHSPLACAAGVSGADLKRRIETIMENKTVFSLNAAKKMLLAGAAAAVIVLPLAAGITPSAFAQADVVLSQEEIAQNLAEQAQFRTAIPYDVTKFDKFVGYYQLGPGSIFTISRDGQHLLTRLTGQVNVEVYPESETKFFARAVTAQMSFTTDSSGNVTELVLHQGGRKMSAKRIDEAVAKGIEATQQKHITDNKSDPARLALLRSHIEGEVNGRPRFDDMSLGLAAARRQQAVQIDKIMKDAGALKSLTFKAVNRQGWDVYVVTYEHKKMEWSVGPLTEDGKLNGLVFQVLN